MFYNLGPWRRLFGDDRNVDVVGVFFEAQRRRHADDSSTDDAHSHFKTFFTSVSLEIELTSLLLEL